MLFESLVEIQNKIESSLHCIDIYADDCSIKFIGWGGLRISLDMNNEYGGLVKIFFLNNIFPELKP